MVFKLEVLHKKWADYTRTTSDLLNLMMQYQFDVDTTPVLVSESEKVCMCRGCVHQSGTQMKIY